LYDKYIEEKLAIEKWMKIKELREQIKLNNTKKQLLQKYDCEFVDISEDEEAAFGLSEQCRDINKIIYAESRLTWVSHANNPFDWPVFPYAWLSTFFRDDGYIEQVWNRSWCDRYCCNSMNRN